MERIFDPYFSTKPRGADKGMGLGLAVAYAIVKKHHGEMTVHSTPGKGTSVNIYLRAIARPEARQAGLPAEPAAGFGQTGFTLHGSDGAHSERREEIDTQSSIANPSGA